MAAKTNEKRPVLTIPLTAYDRVLEAFSALTAVSTVVFTIMVFPDLPDRIPAHFNAAGEVDRWGSRGEIIILPLLGISQWILMTWINRRPHIFNYLSPITPENAFVQYRAATRLIRHIKLVTTSLFAAIQFQMYAVALNQPSFPFWVIGALVGLIPVSLAVWIMDQRSRKDAGTSPS